MSKLTRVLALTLIAACEESGEPDHPASLSSAVLAQDAALGSAADAAARVALPSHLPCEIEVLLNARCKNCHAPSTAPNRPITLLSYEDLTLPSRTAPGLTNAQRAAQLVSGGMMPPSGGMSAAEIQALATWVQRGAPRGNCGESNGVLEAGVPRASDAAISGTGAADAASSPLRP